jgi:thiol-disulfide isomerase/thioredoxin
MNSVKLSIFVLGLFIFNSCKEALPAFNDEIEVFEVYDELQSLIDGNSEKTLVINFWATTCPPCLKEMPHFSELQNNFDTEEVKVLLISLDEMKHMDSRVIPFVERHEITPEVILLGDQNYSAWTDEIDPSWFGALPATLILKGEKRNFRFGAYETYQELLDDLNRIDS